MVMDGEREEDGGEGEREDRSVSEELDAIPAGSQEEEHLNLVHEMESTIESVAQFGDFRRTQKKECYSLVRRMKLLLPFLEEIRDLDPPISENGITCLCNLKKVLLLAKKLLKTCNEGSKIFLVSLFASYFLLNKIEVSSIYEVGSVSFFRLFVIIWALKFLSRDSVIGE